MGMISKIIVVAGARPNFMKIALLVQQLRAIKSKQTILVHTGQHYDYQMSEVFFQELKIPKPDVFLNVGSGSHAVQTAKIMTEFEGVMLKEKPDLVIVAGDVNSTLACALVATKMNVKVAHIESGLRSLDRGMPEEINRLATDAISDYLFVSEASGLHNLKKEGADPKKVFYVGNVMIDALIANLPTIRKSGILKKLGVKPGSYAALTLHRPSNVDTKQALLEIYDILKNITSQLPLVYPIHPRTKSMIEKHGLKEKFAKLAHLKQVQPLGYIDFIQLVKNAKFMLTDSGGIQEESTYLGVPCLTMRENTERPSTIEEGTNKLMGRNKAHILKAVRQIMAGRWKKGRIPMYWDGKSTARIVKIIKK